MARIIRFRWHESWRVQMPQVREPFSFDSILAQSMDTKVSSLSIAFEGVQEFDIIDAWDSIGFVCEHRIDTRGVRGRSRNQTCGKQVFKTTSVIRRTAEC